MIRGKHTHIAIRFHNENFMHSEWTTNGYIYCHFSLTFLIDRKWNVGIGFYFFDVRHMLIECYKLEENWFLLSFYLCLTSLLLAMVLNGMTYSISIVVACFILNALTKNITKNLTFDFLQIFVSISIISLNI